MEYIWEDSPDGYVSTRKEKVIRCKDCEMYEPETKMCECWGAWTEPEGFCHKTGRSGKNEEGIR